MTPYQLGKEAAPLKPLPTNSPMDFRAGDHAKGVAGFMPAVNSFSKALGLGGGKPPGGVAKPPASGAPRAAANMNKPMYARNGLFAPGLYTDQPYLPQGQQAAPQPSVPQPNYENRWMPRLGVNIAANSAGIAPGAAIRGAGGLAVRGAGGLLATPINAAMEGLDAAGALPQAMGGTGLALPKSWKRPERLGGGSWGVGREGVGWADEADFRNSTSIGQAGDAFEYTGPGWQGLNYLGATANSWTHPLRTYGNYVSGMVDTPMLAVKAFFKNRELDRKQQELDQLARQRAGG